jgi:hypothetical protein
MKTATAALILCLAAPACAGTARAQPAQAPAPPGQAMDEAAMARLLKGEDGDRVRRFAATAAVAAHCGQDPGPHVQALMRALRARPGRSEEQVVLLGRYGEAVAAEAQTALARLPCDAKMRAELDRRKRQDLDSLRR